MLGAATGIAIGVGPDLISSGYCKAHIWLLVLLIRYSVPAITRL